MIESQPVDRKATRINVTKTIRRLQWCHDVVKYFERLQTQELKVLGSTAMQYMLLELDLLKVGAAS